MFAQHLGNQGNEGGVNGHRKKEEGDKEGGGVKKNHIAAESLLVYFTIPLCSLEAQQSRVLLSLHYYCTETICY